jgi:hypothetical protein
MIVIVDRTRDPHVRAVKAHLEKRGVGVFVADPAELGEGAELSFWPEAPERTEWRRSDRTVLRMSEARAIWYRPKAPPTTPIEVDDREDRRFIEREWHELIRGVFMSSEVPQINPFHAMTTATKPHQLAAAYRVGLAVPDTLITSSARRVLTFVDQAGDVVHKVMTAPDDRLLATKRWEDDDAKSLHALELCPAIFQRRVDGMRELRITAVGERLFAAEFSTTFVDGRLDLAASHVPHELPPSVARALLVLLEHLSLPYAAVDMRIDARGEYHFLEANPAGQFLWIEIRTGMPISAAVADLLYDESRRCHSAASPPRGDLPETHPAP